MHARELIELAAVVATHTPTLIQSGAQLPASGIEEYWCASKARLDRWGRALRLLADSAASAGARPARHDPLHTFGLLEEILTGEVLTRVWTAALCAYDRSRGTDQCEPVARSVLIGQLEVRHRVLSLLVRGPVLDAAEAVRLNHLRRRVERWTDVLVGRLAMLYDIGEFAFQPERAKQFAADLQSEQHGPGGRHAWALMVASLRAAFGRGLSPISPNADLNARIAAGVVACFPTDVFDSTGVLRSFWLARLAAITNDAQGMIEDLLGPAPSGESGAGSWIVRRNLLRRFDTR